MAINPLATAAAIAGGVAVGIGANLPAINKVSPWAPAAIAVGVGLGAAAMAKNGALSAIGFAAIGVGGALLYQGIATSSLAGSQKTAGMVGMSPTILPVGAYGNPSSHHPYFGHHHTHAAGMSPTILPVGAYANPSPQHPYFGKKTTNIIPDWRQRDRRTASRYGYAAGPYTSVVGLVG
jgi:hypothetical protein